MFTNCIVPEGGYPTQDDYLRVLSKPRSLGGKLVMLHRLEWEKVFGPIPDGYEINHRCKNRRCQNVVHLECIPRSVHRTKDNKLRYLEDIVSSLRLIQNNPGKSQAEIIRMLGLTKSRVDFLVKEFPEIKKYVKYGKKYAEVH